MSQTHHGLQTTHRFPDPDIKPFGTASLRGLADLSQSGTLQLQKQLQGIPLQRLKNMRFPGIRKFCPAITALRFPEGTVLPAHGFKIFFHRLTRAGKSDCQRKGCPFLRLQFFGKTHQSFLVFQLHCGRNDVGAAAAEPGVIVLAAEGAVVHLIHIEAVVVNDFRAFLRRVQFFPVRDIPAEREIMILHYIPFPGAGLKAADHAGPGNAVMIGNTAADINEIRIRINGIFQIVLHLCGVISPPCHRVRAADPFPGALPEIRNKSRIIKRKREHGQL